MKKFILIVLKSFTIALISIMITLTWLTVVRIEQNQFISLAYIEYLNEKSVERNLLLEKEIEQNNLNQLNKLETNFKTQLNQNKILKKELRVIDTNITNKINKTNDKIFNLKNEIFANNKKPSYEYLKSVTVRVLHMVDEENDKYGTGTGSVVKITEDFTYILTNRHVAPIDSGTIYVERDNKRYKAEVLKNGVIRDLSLIRVTGKIQGTTVIKGLAKTKEQDKVYSVGMYLGYYNIYTEGTVAGWEEDDRLMNLPCLYGCSGSGVFDKDGNMVAVVFAGNGYNFMGFDTAKAICVPYIGIYTFLEGIL